MKISQLSMISFGFMLALSACSVETKMDGGAIPAPGPGPGPSKVAVEGAWKSGCNDEGGLFQVETMTFAGETFKTTAQVFTNPSCSGAPMFEAEVDGTFAVVGRSGAVAGADEVDVIMADPDTGTVSKYYLTVLVEGGVIYLPPSSHDSKASRASAVDRTKPYTKIGG